MIDKLQKKNVLIAIKNPITLLGTKQVVFLLSPGCHIYSDDNIINSACFSVEKNSVNLLVTDIIDNEKTQSYDVDFLFSLCQKNPQLRIVIYADFLTSESYTLLQKNTQVSFLSRNNSLNEVYKTFSVALNDSCDKISLDSFHFPSKKITLSEELTHCQKLILLHLLNGLSQYEISRLLHRSNKTVSSHKCSAMRKLGLKNDSELFLKRNEILLELTK